MKLIVVVGCGKAAAESRGLNRDGAKQIRETATALRELLAVHGCNRIRMYSAPQRCATDTAERIARQIGVRFKARDCLDMRRRPRGFSTPFSQTRDLITGYSSEWEERPNRTHELYDCFDAIILVTFPQDVVEFVEFFGSEWWGEPEFLASISRDHPINLGYGQAIVIEERPLECYVLPTPAS